MRFKNERGLDGGGLRTEIFAAFLSALESSLLNGNIEKVPVVNPKTASCQILFHIGRILSHRYVLTGYFPLCLAKVFTTHLVSSTSVVSNDMLIQSIMNYIDTAECQAVKSCLSGASYSDTIVQDVIVPMLSSFNCRTLPNQGNFKELITQVAHYTLISQPHYAPVEMRRGMLESHAQLWQKCLTTLAIDLHSVLAPDPQRVWRMISEPVLCNSSEVRTFDFFRRYVMSLSPDNLSKLLRFVTGSPQCGLQTIRIQFAVPESSFTRRPTASTCRMILYLPITHETFTSFAHEVNEILENSHLWSFDGL